MKNLENFGVQELNSDETKKTNGGNPIALVALTLAVLNTDWERVGDDISRGWHSL